MRLPCFLVIGIYLICSTSASAALIGESGIYTPLRRPYSQSKPNSSNPRSGRFSSSIVSSVMGPRKQQAGLRLDSREALLRGTDAGPVVVPGDPVASPLIEAIGHGAAIKMPPRSKLAPEAIADLTNWVRLGLPWPRRALRSETRNPPLAELPWKQNVIGRFSRSSIRSFPTS